MAICVATVIPVIPLPLCEINCLLSYQRPLDLGPLTYDLWDLKNVCNDFSACTALSVLED